MSPYRHLTFQKKKRKKREKEELQKIVHALVQRNLIIIKIMDSLKNAGHAEVALFFESFRAPFYKKKKNREERMEKKKKKRIFVNIRLRSSE